MDHERVPHFAEVLVWWLPSYATARARASYSFPSSFYQSCTLLGSVFPLATMRHVSITPRAQQPKATYEDLQSRHDSSYQRRILFPFVAVVLHLPAAAHLGASRRQTQRNCSRPKDPCCGSANLERGCNPHDLGREIGWIRRNLFAVASTPRVRAGELIGSICFHLESRTGAVNIHWRPSCPGALFTALTNRDHAFRVKDFWDLTPRADFLPQSFHISRRCCRSETGQEEPDTLRTALISNCAKPTHLV
jgi:hypothetical protein